MSGFTTQSLSASTWPDFAALVERHARGALLPDRSHLFNASLAGNVRRAIDFHEGARLDVPALKALVLAAVAANQPPIRGKSSRPAP